jgi:hypothetical protein
MPFLRKFDVINARLGLLLSTKLDESEKNSVQRHSYRVCCHVCMYESVSLTDLSPQVIHFYQWMMPDIFLFQIET